MFNITVIVLTFSYLLFKAQLKSHHPQDNFSDVVNDYLLWKSMYVKDFACNWILNIFRQYWGRSVFSFSVGHMFEYHLRFNSAVHRGKPKQVAYIQRYILKGRKVTLQLSGIQIPSAAAQSMPQDSHSQDGLTIQDASEFLSTAFVLQKWRRGETGGTP